MIRIERMREREKKWNKTNRENEEKVLTNEIKFNVELTRRTKLEQQNLVDRNKEK